MDIHSKLRGHGLPEPLINLAASLVEGGVLQGSCRVSRVFKLLFSLPAAPSLG